MNPLFPLRAWNRFWFAPISAKPLGAFRILYGCIAVCNLLLLTYDFDYWLTSRGLLQGDEAREIAGAYRPSILFWFNDPTSARVVFGLTLAAAVGLTLGWRTRLMGILYYIGILSIHHRNLVTASGADTLVNCIAFYLMLSPCGAAYSLDARRLARLRGGAPADALIIPWAQRLMQIQVCMIYMVTSILKANGATWLSGTALHYVLVNREVGRFDLSSLAAYPVLVNVLTFGGVAIELSLAFLLWVKAARPMVMLAGLSLHLGIFFLINIPIFGELTTGLYLLFFGSQEWESIEALGVRSAARLRSWLPSPSPGRSPSILRPMAAKQVARARAARSA